MQKSAQAVDAMPDYRHKWKPIVAKYLADNIKPINKPNTGVRDERENITHSDRGTSFTYKIAKLKRDYGEDDVMFLLCLVRNCPQLRTNF